MVAWCMWEFHSLSWLLRHNHTLFIHIPHFLHCLITYACMFAMNNTVAYGVCVFICGITIVKLMSVIMCMIDSEMYS